MKSQGQSMPPNEQLKLTHYPGPRLAYAKPRPSLQGEHTPLMGQALLSEYEDILGRPEIFEKSPASDSERRALFSALASISVWTRIYYLWRPNLPDEADNHVMELAVAGGAKAVVTFNRRDLVRSELYFPEILVVSPAELLENEE